MGIRIIGPRVLRNALLGATVISTGLSVYAFFKALSDKDLRVRFLTMINFLLEIASSIITVTRHCFVSLEGSHVGG